MELCRKASLVLAVEQDRGLAGILKEREEANPNLRVLEGDIMGMDFKRLAGILRQEAGSGAVLKVVSNLPYSISLPVLIRLLESRAGFRLLVLMLQKEAGERILSLPGSKNYAFPSVMTRMYGFPEEVARVSKNSFFPRPRVDSVLIRIETADEPVYPVPDPGFWKILVSKAFSGRRKMLKNALTSGSDLGYTVGEITAACERSGIDPRSRPEDLSAGDYARLAGELFRAGRIGAEQE